MKQLELREESGWVQTPNKDKPVQTCWTPPGSLSHGSGPGFMDQNQLRPSCARFPAQFGGLRIGRWSSLQLRVKLWVDGLCLRDGGRSFRGLHIEGRRFKHVTRTPPR